MPKVKELGLRKHLDEAEKRSKRARELKEKEQARKEEVARHRKKAELYSAKAKEKRAKSGLRKISHKHRKTAGKGITLGQFFRK